MYDDKTISANNWALPVKHYLEVDKLHRSGNESTIGMSSLGLTREEAIQRLNIQKEKLRQGCVKREETIRNIQMIFDRDMSTIKILEQAIEITDLESKISKLKQENINFRNQIIDSKIEKNSIEQLKNEFALQKNENQVLKNENDNLKLKIQSMERTIEDQKSIIERLRKENIKFRDCNDALIAQDVETKLQRDHFEKEMDKYKNENDRYKSEIDKLKRNAKTLQEELNYRKLSKSDERGAAGHVRRPNKRNHISEANKSKVSFENKDVDASDQMSMYTLEIERLEKQVIDLQVVLGMGEGLKGQVDEETKKKFMFDEMVANRNERFMFVERGVELTRHKELNKSQKRKIDSLESEYYKQKKVEAELREKIHKYETTL
ncbi:uncharacterized protein I206_101440 [Kwoniella pini CBS 10737]|uniref:Uncharacterized protein n=1 Tax=Kwoniella pini CBS 10737 TaxID=1296096 RepID=A0A1B9HWN2_9TREE|nr:uncharacterized protein I206_06589 [Kwoniella pini CBS 10737]OCF47683.1 hypothetical protein I206_06589 [Kwoniella pini CBS 10737]